MMIKISSKFKDVLDGFNCNKYPFIIYFWKPQSKSRLMMVTPGHLDIQQEDHDDQDVLQVQGWILMDFDDLDGSLWILMDLDDLDEWLDQGSRILMIMMILMSSWIKDQHDIQYERLLPV